MTPRIAIVGMACRYPDADTPDELLQAAVSGRRAFRALPAGRLNLEDYAPGFDGDPDGIVPVHAALLKNYRFDAAAYRIPTATLGVTDLAHWLALDVASEALADAGFGGGAGLPGDAATAVIGNTLTGEFSRAQLLRLRWPYVRRQLAGLLPGDWEEERRRSFVAGFERAYKEPFPAPNDESLSGGLANTIAGRICNFFDIRAGGYSVDGACASSLLAVANACARLVSEEVDVALAGGVDLSLDPFELVGFSRAGALAERDMLVFDADNDGFWPGEGCGMVVLMRLDQALAQDRRVYGVIRGWGISTDGRGGLTRPTVAGQAHAIRRAHAMARTPEEEIGYVEAHGTGTVVGDVTEVRALAEFLGSGSASIPIGSVKGNIGHTKAAAGLAGLIKTVMMMRERVIPPTTGCRDPHPVFEDTGHRLAPVLRARDWHATSLRRAGVSAFGFGGINTHVAVEEHPGCARAGGGVAPPGPPPGPQHAELLVFSASELGRLREKLVAAVGLAAKLSYAELTDFGAYLAAKPRGLFRAAVVAEGPRDLVERLTTLLSWIDGGVADRVDAECGVFLSSGRETPDVVFLFPGQGAPAYLRGTVWHGRFPETEGIRRAAALPARADAQDTAVAQPAIVAASLAGLHALRHVGLRARCAVGHSVGELPALCWAGGMDESTALAVSKARGRIMAGDGDSAGAMALVRVGDDDLPRILSGTDVSVACINGPREHVLAGSVDGVDEVLGRAREAGVSASLLPVSHAFHTVRMGSSVPPLREFLAGVRFGPVGRDVYSTVTGALLERDADLAAHLCEQVAAPVRFRDAVGSAERGSSAKGARLFVEVGPGQGMTRLMRRSGAPHAVAVDAGSGSVAGLLSAVGAAFALGAPVRPMQLFEGRMCRDFHPDDPLEFVPGPCEVAPLDSTRGGERPVPRGVANAAPPEPGPRSGDGSGSPLAALRRRVAVALQVEEEAVAAEDRFLDDLHLSSIAVGQIVADVADALGAGITVSVTDFAVMTVGEAAETLADIVRDGPQADRNGSPTGVDGWVRAFGDEFFESPFPSGARPAFDVEGWSVYVGRDDPDLLRIAGSFRVGDAGAGEAGDRCRAVLLLLPRGPRADCLQAMLAAAKEAAALKDDALMVVFQHGGGGAALARSVYLESPGLSVRVVSACAGGEGAAGLIRREAIAAPRGYSEIHYDARGRRRMARMKVLPDFAPPAGGARSWPVGPGEVVVVTGGAKGIGAECALALAQQSRAHVVLVGRSAAEDGVVKRTLYRGTVTGASMSYVPADVVDPEAVSRAMADIENRHGRVRGLVHAAGVNEPVRVPDLTLAELDRTVSVKVDGLRNLLQCIDPSALKMVVAFGSIIARIGLPGEAHYALANDWMSAMVAEFSFRYPRCHAFTVDWSVWTGAGMGERLGSVDSLARRGVSALSVQDGVRWFSYLACRRRMPARLVVTGRFGEPPTVDLGTCQSLDRFIENPVVVYPGVEVIVESTLSFDKDPYLGDHVIDGVAILPGVMLLEAMAQAVCALEGTPTGWSYEYESVEFAHPVAVRAEEDVTLRLSALRHREGLIEVVVRTSASAFRLDHVRALCRLPSTGRGEALQAPVRAARGSPTRAQPLYGSVLFQGPRFRRVRSYHLLAATRCDADVGGPTRSASPWFGEFLAQDLRLGDPAIRDAAIHCLQACMPHRRILPVSIESVTFGALDEDTLYRVYGEERSRSMKHLVFDVDIRNEDGDTVEAWRGLRMRIVENTALPAVVPFCLADPFLTRMASDCFGSVDVEVGLALGKRSAKSTLGPLGVAADGGGAGSVRSYSEPFRLDLRTSLVAGCDIEGTVVKTPVAWRRLLGASDWELAAWLQAEYGYSVDAAALRIWCAREALKKAGGPTMDELVVRRVLDNDRLEFKCGHYCVVTWNGRIEEHGLTTALAARCRALPVQDDGRMLRDGDRSNS